MAVERREATVQGRRILVIANETLIGTVLHEAIRFRARNVGGEVLVVAPALDTRMPEWTTDGDGARRTAEQRLSRSLDRLRAAGINARGQIGDSDPLQAIADALGLFAADEIIIATHPGPRSNWLGHDLVAPGPRPLRPARPAHRRRPRAPAGARGRHDPPRRPPPPPAAADADPEPHADAHRELRARAMSRRPRIPACPPRRLTSCAAASGHPVFRRVAPPRAPRRRPERRPPAAHGGWRRPR